MEILLLSCPYCAAKISSHGNECEYCGFEYMLSSYTSMAKIGDQDLKKYVRAYKDALKDEPDNPNLNYSAGLCSLRLRLFDKALESFEKAIADDIDSGDAYFFAAVSMLGGKMAFLSDKKRIDKAIEYVNAAAMLEDRAIYHLMLAYLKYDYYKRKCLNISPSFQDHLNDAESFSLDDSVREELFAVLGVESPAGFLS